LFVRAAVGAERAITKSASAVSRGEAPRLAKFWRARRMPDSSPRLAASVSDWRAASRRSGSAKCWVRLISSNVPAAFE